jgi:hypothetical protein
MFALGYVIDNFVMVLRSPRLCGLAFVTAGCAAQSITLHVGTPRGIDERSAEFCV